MDLVWFTILFEIHDPKLGTLILSNSMLQGGINVFLLERSLMMESAFEIFFLPFFFFVN